MELLKELEKKKSLILLVGLCLFISIILFWVITTRADTKVPIEEPVNHFSEELEETQEITDVMYVDIKGAVKSPGMYEVSSDMRLLNVIDLAGGLVDSADSQRVNFSQKVSDQMVIYVPTVGEELTIVEEVQSVGTTKDESNSLININQASKEELMQLNGVGEKKAEKIIDYREEHGSFHELQELKNVNGFGEKSFESLEKYITI